MSFMWGETSRRFPLLVGSLLLLGLLGLPTTTAASAAQESTVTPARASALTTARFESRLVALTNARRQKIGCRALRANSALTRAARAHTTRMVRTGTFSHQVSREAGLGARITRAGYRHWTALAENIAWGKGVTPAGVFSMWMRSAGHRANIQNCRLRDVGYGVAYSGREIWVTGDYGRR